MIGRSIVIIACAVTVAAGCYPDRAINSTAETASVTTLFDQEANFGVIRKYTLVDSVIYLPLDEDEEVPAATQAAILAQTRANLNALGWTEVVDPTVNNSTEVYVTAAVTSATYVFFDYWYDWWYWYGYWPPGWGPGYGWYYPPYWSVYAYQTGTLVLAMADARPPGRPDNRVPLIWTAAINGVLSDAATNITVATAGIDQAFDQSPYLGGQ